VAVALAAPGGFTRGVCGALIAVTGTGALEGGATFATLEGATAVSVT